MNNAYAQQEAGHVLDAHVQVSIFEKEIFWSPSGSRMTAYCKGESDCGFGVPVPGYSENMKDAWKVVDRMKAFPPPKWDRFVKFLTEEVHFEDRHLLMEGQKVPDVTFSDMVRNLTPIKICRAALETIRTFKIEAAALA